MNTITTIRERCVIDDSGCWIPHRRPSGNGYCFMSIDGNEVYAHRAAFEAVNGPIGPKLVIDHLCRNPRCCNPSHLEAVPQLLNAIRGAKTRLTEADVAAIRHAAVVLHERSETIALRYGIARSYVSAVVRGERWSHVGGSVKATPTRYRRVAKVTEAVAIEIRAMRNAGATLSKIARTFGISVSYTSEICSGYLDRRHAP